MKAVQVTKYGGPEVFQINEIEKPSLKEDQILVEVRAASINPFDDKLKFGYMKENIPLKFPWVIGGDFAGVITELGSSVKNFQIGDEVFGQSLILNGGSGAMSEFTAANTKNTSLKPKNLDFIEASSLVLVGVSAIQGIEEHIKLQKGQKILIHGGSGGIGSIAIQLAKHIGAYVITTASVESLEFVRSLGADQVIDYHSQNFNEVVKDIDTVFDTVGGEIPGKSLKILKKGGVLVSMNGPVDENLATESGVRALVQNTGVNADRLNRLTELVDKGVIKPQVDKVFPTEQAKNAFEYFESGHPKGKVVVNIK